MGEHRRGRWSKEEKFKIALAAVKGDKTIAQLAEEFRVHPNQIRAWKQQLLEHGSDIVSTATEKRAGLTAKEREELIQTIGHQTVIIDWLKKDSGTRISGAWCDDRPHTRRAVDRRAMQDSGGQSINLVLPRQG